jgi:tetratricopeptide (TPR) repeat protein
LAFTYWWEARQGWSSDREASIRKGIELAEKAIAMNRDDTGGYMFLGNLRQLQGKHDKAVALREKAVALAPNDFQTNWGLGAVLYKSGQPERAIEVLEHAERLSPHHPAALMWSLAMAQLAAGRYEEAVATGKRGIARTPNHPYPRFIQAAAFAALGRMDEARAEAEELLRIKPDFTVSAWKPTQPFKDKAIVDRWGELLVSAGLPE